VNDLKEQQSSSCRVQLGAQSFLDLLVDITCMGNMKSDILMRKESINAYTDIHADIRTDEARTVRGSGPCKPPPSKFNVIIKINACKTVGHVT